MALSGACYKLAGRFVKDIQHSFHLQVPQGCRSVSSYKYLKPFEPTTGAPEFEVSNNPEEWKYVERLLPPKCVPTPKPKEQYTSGWSPPAAQTNSHPFFIARNKNHMVPVYLLIRKRGTQRITQLKHVQGDVWALEKELREYCKKETGKNLGVRIDELAGNVSIRGDFVYHVKNWVLQCGF